MKYAHPIIYAGTLVAAMAFATPVCSQEHSRKAGPQDAVIKELLIESRKAFLADPQVKEDSRGLHYTYLREGINHSLLLHVAAMLVPHDGPEAVAVAEEISRADVRAFALTQLALMQAKREQKEQAEQTLKKAVACIKSDEVKDSADALWPHAAAVLLWLHGDIPAAEKAAAEMGCPWDALDKEERQYQLARYHLAQGDARKALQALHELPPETFRLRRGGEALRNDQGAGLYFWAQQPDSALTAEHVLWEWLEGSGKLELMEQVATAMADTSMEKAACLVCLAEKCHKAGKADKASELLKRASALAESQKNEAVRDALKMDLSLVRARLSGKSPVEALKESGLLESSRGKPWRATIVRQVFESGDYELGLKLTEGSENDNITRAWVATALTKAGKLDEAFSRAKQAEGLLGPPRILLVIALEQSRGGNDAGALETLKDALGKAREVRSTNKWFPEGEVMHQEKWDVMDRVFGAMVSIGHGDVAVKEYGPYEGSIRRLARGLGARKDVDTVRTWMKGFTEKKFGPAASALALLGLAEGLESAKDDPGAEK